MTRKDLFKTFIFLKKQSQGFELSEVINNALRLDAYEYFMQSLNKIGFDDTESNMILGSLVLTLENGKIKDIDENTNPDLIEIQEPNDRSVGYTEYGRYKNYGKYYISETYSDVEALYKAKNGLFDDSEVYDSDYEDTDQNIDDRDIEIE